MSDPQDLLRDALGAASFLLMAATFDRSARWHGSATPALRALVRGASLALLAVAFAPAVPTAWVYAQRAAAFPRLFDFEDSWERAFLRPWRAQLRYTGAPAGWERQGDGQVGRVVFIPPRNPALRFEEPYPDWRGYETLRFSVYSEKSEPVSIILRILDRTRRGRDRERFTRTLSIEPGLNDVAVPLADVRAAPEGREMDMSSIDVFVLFAANPERPFTLYFDAFRLE